MTEPALTSVLATHFGVEAGSIRLRPVTGGDTARSFCASVGAKTMFVKQMLLGNEALVAEADGLAALEATDTVRVPAVLGQGTTGGFGWLILEWLELVPWQAQEVELARALARLHSQTAPAFGWHRDNFIGTTPQQKPRCMDWSAFWRDARLLPMVDAAAGCGMSGTGLAQLQRLAGRLELFLSGDIRPSLVHGDLWAGNVAVCGGQPVIFDPAVYFGHHEVDLAMLELFGRPGPAFFDAYNDLLAISDGYYLRRDLYNLYHLLNHYRLFGGGYGDQAVAVAARLVAEVS